MLMLMTLTAALLGVAPPQELVHVPDPRGEFVTSCRKVVNGQAGRGPARRLFVEQTDGAVSVGKDRPTFAVPRRDAERLRHAIFDENLLDEQFANSVRWRTGETWDETLVTGVLPLGDGTLVSVDGGKWGGGLIWMTDSAIRLLSRVPVNALAQHGEAVLAASGSDHGFGGAGALMRVVLEEDGPVIDLTYEVPVNVRGVAVTDGTIVMATKLGPIVVDADGILYRRATNHTAFFDDWEARQHPSTANSVAIDAEGAVHVGLSGGYAVYKSLPDSFDYDYYALTRPCQGRER